MQFGWNRGGAVIVAAMLPLLIGAPTRAADGTGVRTVAEELGSRTKAPDSREAPKDRLSDSAVRVMSTFALSILPDEVPERSGAMVKLDKSDPNKYLIPLDDARSVIRVATRSAYAEACQLPELEKANYDALIRGEQARKIWTREQMMFIKALHTFATSYFAGNVKITEEAADPKAAPPKAGNAAPAPNATTMTSKKLECSPEQRQKVTEAIGAYVRAGVPATPQASAPAPVAGGAN